MSRPTTGSATVLALGLGHAGKFGMPSLSPGLIRHNALLPIGGQLIGEENPSGEVNPSGFIRKAVPGAKGGPFEASLSLTARNSLEYYHHLFGKVTKEAVVAAVAATGDFTLTDDATDGETVTIGDDVYEFDDDAAVGSGHILVDISGGATSTLAATALFNAINASGTEPVTATNPSAGVVTVTADVAGRDGNEIATTTTAADGAWGAATLEDGEGIFTYTFEPDWDNHINSHFWALLKMAPVERLIAMGIRFGTIEEEIKDNERIPMKMSGFMAHGSLMAVGVQVSGTGTFALGVFLRGLPADPSAGPIWMQITDDDPLTVKFLQKPTTPAGGDWAAATTEFVIPYDVNLQGDWMNVRSSLTGLDLGVFAENKDNLEVGIPGVAADHASGFVIGDVFRFDVPGAWSADPPMTVAHAANRFTSAHWISRLRNVGDVAWIEKPVETGTFAWEWAIDPGRGNLSRYAFEMYRSGLFTPTIELERVFVDRFFADGMDRHERIEGQMALEGEQLNATYREGIVATYPSLAITEGEHPADDEGLIKEKLTLTGETNDDEDPPCTVVVTTDRNWTPQASATP